ncbi:MAG: response regulator transcription factor [Anaerolineae bacterium]|nr:response regulator transcription factor [Anaerolineae bacterium]MCB9130678.1 response regulator transcription factor [Anaerolineales bacterium]MCB0236335.1 response regulator transcription factor [Anaerolineae bacterium]MCB0241188.1 response regulator transcription factor [Anaerolineae bacterium]MCB0246035.1 response regulator transcription factor [Anaerolineae bacterium]
MPDHVRLLLVDDQRLMRDGLRTLLEMEPEMSVVGEASNGQEALKLFATLRPDVVLMDVRMPVMDGVEATRQLRARWPDVRVIILTTFDDDEYVFEGLRAGALGYLLKDVGMQELTDAIHTVMAGGVLIEPSVARKVVAEFARMTPQTPAVDSDLIDALSEREIEILKLLAEGMTNREIAGRLYLAEGTVKNYVTNILSKIGARDRTQAALRARELQLL